MFFFSSDRFLEIGWFLRTQTFIVDEFQEWSNNMMGLFGRGGLFILWLNKRKEITYYVT